MAVPGSRSAINSTADVPEGSAVKPACLSHAIQGAVALQCRYRAFHPSARLLGPERGLRPHRFPDQYQNRPPVRRHCGEQVQAAPASVVAVRY